MTGRPGRILPAGLLFLGLSLGPAAASAAGAPASGARAAVPADTVEGNRGSEAASPLPAETVAGPTSSEGAGADPGAAVPLRRPSAALLDDRRARLLDRLGSGVALVPAAHRLDLASDYPQASDFRQDSDFLYLTGLETPGAVLALAVEADGTRHTALFLPEPVPGQARWTGPTPGPSEAARASGVDDVRSMGELRDWIDDLRPCRDLPLFAPTPAAPGAGGTVEGIVASTRDVRDVRPVVAELRQVKDPFELRLIRKAVAITDRGLARAAREIRPGAFEYEVEAALEYVFRSSGAERVGFPSIVASGPNSVVLHYDDSRRRMEAGELVVLDVGAAYSYYTADVTRTLPVSGRFTPRQRALYDLVLGAWRAAVEAVRPGATMADVEGAARVHMREHAGDLCGETSCVRRFVHGVGHWLGMDVHDPGSYTRPFEPGMVLTVEPGVYLPAEDLGIRIEDDVLVTETGRRVLSRTPRTAEAVEAMMAER